METQRASDDPLLLKTPGEPRHRALSIFERPQKDRRRPEGPRKNQGVKKEGPNGTIDLEDTHEPTSEPLIFELFAETRRSSANKQWMPDPETFETR